MFTEFLFENYCSYDHMQWCIVSLHHYVHAWKAAALLLAPMHTPASLSYSFLTETEWMWAWFWVSLAVTASHEQRVVINMMGGTLYTQDICVDMLGCVECVVVIVEQVQNWCFVHFKYPVCKVPHRSCLLQPFCSWLCSHSLVYSSDLQVCA